MNHCMNAGNFHQDAQETKCQISNVHLFRCTLWSTPTFRCPFTIFNFCPHATQHVNTAALWYFDNCLLPHVQTLQLQWKFKGRQRSLYSSQRIDFTCLFFTSGQSQCNFYPTFISDLFLLCRLTWYTCTDHLAGSKWYVCWVKSAGLPWVTLWSSGQFSFDRFLPLTGGQHSVKQLKNKRSCQQSSSWQSWCF